MASHSDSMLVALEELDRSSQRITFKPFDLRAVDEFDQGVWGVYRNTIDSRLLVRYLSACFP